MKMNEIPDKIYLSYETDEDDKENIFIDYMWYRNPFEGRILKNIEYVRTDAFIEKACEHMVNCIEDFMLRRMEIWDEECKKQTLENLREALKK